MSAIPKFNNLNKQQLEILKLFSRKLEDNDLIEIKRLIVKYLADKITNLVDKEWDKKNWTNDEMNNILNSPQRTPYNPIN